MLWYAGWYDMIWYLNIFAEGLKYSRKIPYGNSYHQCLYLNVILTPNLLETHECVLSTVPTDVLVLKYQDLSIHSADQISIALDQFQTKYYIYNEQHQKMKLNLKKYDPVGLGLRKICSRTMEYKTSVNSSPPRAAFMRQWIGSALAQVMACRLFGT